MPRTANPDHVRRWAELFAEEKTIAQIRKDHRDRTGKTVDPRTITRAIEKTRAEIAVNAANVAEIRRGIREHGEKLLASLEPLAKVVRSTVRGQLNPLPIYAIDTDHAKLGTSTANYAGDSWNIQISGDNAIELRLLQEHLPNDKFWRMLEKFSGSASRWIAARVSFASGMKREFGRASRLAGDSVTPAVPFEQAGLSMIDEAACTARIEGRVGIDELLDLLVLGPGSRDLRIGNTRLSSVEQGDIEHYRSLISERAKAVMSSNVGQGVLTARAAFDRMASNLLDELSILGLVTHLPGTCSSCRRFRF